MEMETVPNDQQGRRQDQQEKHVDQGQETHAITVDLPPPSTSPPVRPLQLSSSPPPPQPPVPLKTQSPSLDSPPHSSRSSDQSSLSALSSPHEKPPPLAPLKTQSPSVDSPPHSSRSSNQSSLSTLSSPHEKPPSLPLSPIPISSISGPKAQDGEVHIQAQEQGGQVGNSGEGNSEGRFRPNLPPLRKGRRENIRRRALLGCRILGILFCLISFSVLAADKNQGWAIDSFYGYKEFRYCMTVNVMGFVYSGLQAYDLAYSLTTEKQLVWSRFRYLMDFSLDQTLAYLLLSASSSANFRVEDWESSWGKDKFPTMARASLAFSYLAFLAFAASSLLSGYILLAPKSRQVFM